MTTAKVGQCVGQSGLTGVVFGGGCVKPAGHWLRAVAVEICCGFLYQLTMALENQPQFTKALIVICCDVTFLV